MSSLQTLKRKIKTIVSPFHELICSLHVIYNPEHHPKRLQWALDLKLRMPVMLQENIQTLGQLSNGWIALLDLPDRMGISILAVKESLYSINFRMQSLFIFL